MAYTIDVYRKEIKPCNGFIDFALYVTYFPQLVAGPIERAARLIPQIQKPRFINVDNIRTGVSLILTGGFKKIVIGDTIASPYADMAFNNPTAQSGPFLVLGLCMFSLQIYADFSGYSDIARGVSRLLGIELMVNFKQPYLSRNITEFWRRWHISLSSWLRDYLYVPLGGNRKGVFKTYRNLILTMLIGGLWHGASWTFVFWGGLHGLYLSVHKYLLKGSRCHADWKLSSGLVVVKGLLGIVFTNVLVLITWLFFRADSFPLAMRINVGGSITFKNLLLKCCQRI